MPPPVRFSVLLLGSASLVFTACGGEETSAGSDQPTIVVSTGIWGDVVGEVVGDCADVEVLIPPGVDPHGFELSAREAASLRRADLVVINGLGLEEQLESALESAEADGVTVYAVADDLDPLPFGEAEGEHAEEAEGEHADGGDDPHVWQDPERVARATTLLAAEVAEHTDCDGALLDERAEAYAASVRSVEDSIDSRFEVLPDDARTLVTNHDAFGYFAERYGFEVVGTVIPSGTTLAEPSSAELTELSQTIVDAGVRAIFAETTQSTRLAEALADETGRPIEVVALYSDALGDDSPSDTYLGMIEANAQAITDALVVRR